MNFLICVAGFPLKSGSVFGFINLMIGVWGENVDERKGQR